MKFYYINDVKLKISIMCMNIMKNIIKYTNTLCGISAMCV